MGIPSRVRDFLNSENVSYEELRHDPAYTGQEVAHTLHLSGKKCAKTVVLDCDGKLAMAVVPASFHVDLDLLRTAAGAQTVEIATEQEFKDAFPDCETGAMPPFGNLYAMAVYADTSFGENEEITFNAGTHRELMRMTWADMVRLVNPRVVNLTHRAVVAA